MRLDRHERGGRTANASPPSTVGKQNPDWLDLYDKTTR